MLASAAVPVPLHTRVRRELRSLFLQGVVRVIALLPLRPVLALGSLVAALAWRVARRTRALMLAHLAVAFPERSPAEREAIARGSLRHLAWLAGEVVALRSYDARLEEYVTFAPGAEEGMRAALAQGRGVIVVTGHVGNWDLMARRVARAGMPTSTIAKASGDPRLTAIIERERARGGVETLWRENPSTARAMIRCFKQNRLLGLLIDQDTAVQGVFVPFFGRPAHTPRAAGDLALRFRAPVVVAWCRRRGPRAGDGHEVCAVQVPYDPDPAGHEAEARRITAACTARLEEAIRARPEEWVWMHERWKSQPSPESGRETTASSVPNS